jgi:hypothetical protein
MALKKDPNAVLDYTFDWGPYLTPLNDTIQTVTWITSAGITKVSQSNTAVTATAFVSGGVLGEKETLTCRITTSGGRTDDRSVTLQIVER